MNQTTKRIESKGRILSLFLVLILILGAIPGAAFAGGTALAPETALSNTVDLVYQEAGALTNWNELVAVRAAGRELQDYLLPNTPAAGATGVIVSLIKGDLTRAQQLAEAMVVEGRLVSSTYVYGDALNMIAVEAYNRSAETDPEDGFAPLAYDLNETVATFLTYEEEGGGFGYGYGGDPDATGMALTALSLYQSDPRLDDAGRALVEAGIQSGISFLQATQEENGGFSSWGNNNANSVAVVLSGLIAIGEDPLSGAWTKSGGNPVDALLSFYVSGGGFGFSSDAEADSYATQDAVLALAEFVRGNAFLTTFVAGSDL